MMLRRICFLWNVACWKEHIARLQHGIGVCYTLGPHRFVVSSSLVWFVVSQALISLVVMVASQEIGYLIIRSVRQSLLKETPPKTMVDDYKGALQPWRSLNIGFCWLKNCFEQFDHTCIYIYIIYIIYIYTQIYPPVNEYTRHDQCFVETQLPAPYEWQGQALFGW